MLRFGSLARRGQPISKLGHQVPVRAYHPDHESRERSKTHLVETIHGRSRRWFYDRNDGNLSHQWMWSDDEREFDNMLKRSQSSVKGFNEQKVGQRNLYSRLRAVFHSTQLPSGFPDSVHPCYVSFSTWQFVETVANSITHVQCSQAMLSSVGLPTSVGAAVGGAVAIRWIVKDGQAHFAKLYFTKKYAYAFDYRPKTWGVFAEGMLLLGATFELSTAAAAALGQPSQFIPLAAVGASLQSIAHLAWEATHASFIRWMSLRNNIADITAKADSQMVVAELIGLGVGAAVITNWHEPWQLFVCFALCAPIHFLCTVGRLSSIKFGMLSEPRALQLLNAYVRHHMGMLPLQHNNKNDIVSAYGAALPSHILETQNKSTFFKYMTEQAQDQNSKPEEGRVHLLSLATPDQCHLTDKLFGEWFNKKGWNKVFGYTNIEIGVTINQAFISEEQLFGAVTFYKDELYQLNYNARDDKVYVVYEEDCDDDTVLLSLMQASKLAYDIRKAGYSREDFGLIEWDIKNLIRESFVWTKRHFDQAKALLEDAGWDTEIVAWGDVGNRVYWELPPQRPSPHNQHINTPLVGEELGAAAVAIKSVHPSVAKHTEQK